MIVITTDSEYVAKGATDWIRAWRDGTSRWVVQREKMDWWDRLMKAIEVKEREGIRVQFYLIDGKWNLADSYVKASSSESWYVQRRLHFTYVGLLESLAITASEIHPLVRPPSEKYLVTPFN